MISIAELRARNKKMTQEKLAKELNVSQSTVIRWENDISVITGSNLRNLALYFNVSADELLGVKQKEG